MTHIKTSLCLCMYVCVHVFMLEREGYKIHCKYANFPYSLSLSFSLFEASHNWVNLMNLDGGRAKGR